MLVSSVLRFNSDSNRHGLNSVHALVTWLDSEQRFPTGGLRAVVENLRK